MAKNIIPATVQLVIFGGTGDLSRTKLFPGLFKLYQRDLLPKQFNVLGLARSFEERDAYVDSIAGSLKEEISETFTSESWEQFQECIDYLQMDFTEDEEYEVLKEKLQPDDGNGTLHQLFYLATAPEFFPVITEKLKENGLSESQEEGWPRLVIEKPFGYSLKSAREFNDKICQVFPEDNIYRIDHYLGKEMIQNILILRFANMFFEPIWNKHFIDNIQIISAEEKGIKNRGKYYDKAGALRDMVQSHLLQMLALVAMESPADMSPESIRQEKIKLLKTLAKSSTLGNINDNLVIGQYQGGQYEGEKIFSYQQETDISDDSSTETFAAVRLKIDNLRWGGVPIYLKTGKRLQKKKAQIFVQFKSDFHPAFCINGCPETNLLVINIQPREGVALQFNAKEPGSQEKIASVLMDFCQQAPDLQNTPEAYEELLVAIFKGDQSLFTHWESVRYSWMYIDQLQDFIKDNGLEPEKYEPGSSGPVSAQELLARDDRRWWDEEEFDANT